VQKERKNLSPLRSRLARCEKRMTELATSAQELDAQLTDPALYEVSQRLRQVELNAQRARVALETEEVEAEWLELSEQIEQAGG
jgi:ATP-binding cassette, subfamily F, member 3